MTTPFEQFADDIADVADLLEEMRSAAQVHRPRRQRRTAQPASAGTGDGVAGKDPSEATDGPETGK